MIHRTLSLHGLLLLILPILISSVADPATAQQSCSDMIHVDGAIGADTSGCGGEDSPCATIVFGIQRAGDESFTDVRIAASINYVEEVVVSEGVNLWGGFDPDWAMTGHSIVSGSLTTSGEYYTVRADAINNPTTISDLHIIAPNAATSGKSSYGLHITNSSGLVVQRCIIQGGIGANGSLGADGENASVVGQDGTDGGDADEFITPCNDGSAGSEGTGGTLSNPDTRGGNGGRGGYMDSDCSGFPDLDATAGLNGDNATVYQIGNYGYRGGGGGTCDPGNDGLDGHTVHGAGGAGATLSSVLVGSFWEGQTGSDGTMGEDGTGGGGGGGSGGCDDGTDSYGAGGGGGGSGGSTATSVGSGGMSGGNSTAAFMLSSTCSFINCDFILGTGGGGGKGGTGASGTDGGNGGNGGAGAGDSDPGGNGGDGGAGGDSGAGGGGTAGSSYGIFAENSTINHSGSTFAGGTAGTPGLGGVGSSAAMDGTAGAEGSVSDIGGNGTENNVSLTLTEDPCIEILTLDIVSIGFCAGEDTVISFTAVGGFNGTNVFTAQLSDPSGDFSTPTDIGSIISNTSGSISVTFPETTPSGTGYRIRVVSTATPAIGDANATDIVINALPDVIANTSEQFVCIGNEVTLTGSGADTFAWDGGVTDGVAFTPTSTLNYTVIGTDTVTGCQNSDTVTVTVVPEVDTAVTMVGNILVAIMGGAEYQWLDCDSGNEPIPGADQQTFLPGSSGSYAVSISINGCGDTSSCHNVTIVGLADNLHRPFLNVFPNPNNGILHFESGLQQPVDVTVLSMGGQVVLRRSALPHSSSVDLQGLANGMYVVRFSDRNVSLVKQLIIRR